MLMKLLLLLLLISILYVDSYKSTSDLIIDQGFEVESFSVHTDDDIDITVFRIVPPNTHAPVVVFAHGLLTNSGCFVANLKDEDLSFLLSQAGYDVYLIDFRGTNESPVPDDRWDYTFADMAKYDLPAVIDDVLHRTGQEKVTLVSHSQGGAITAAALSYNAELNNKINLAVMQAPAIAVIYEVSHTVAALGPACTFHLFGMIQELGFKKLMGMSSLLDYVDQKICDAIPLSCDLAISVFAGWDLKNVNKSRTDIYVSRLDTSSVKNFVHGCQCYRGDSFNDYDYGEDGNMDHYSQKNPPQFVLEEITSPVAVYYGDRDQNIVPYDIENGVLPHLKSLVHAKEIAGYNHCDFVFTVNESLVDEMIDLIKKYNPPSL